MNNGSGRLDGKFIYVFSEDAKKEFVQTGFFLFRSNPERNLYIFLNKNNLSFSDDVCMPDVSYVITDTLTF